MIETTLEPSIEPPTLRSAHVHAQVYHYRCGHCSAVAVADIDTDTVRRICPACGRCLTLPASLTATCGFCRAEGEYIHTLAGHSTACFSCHRPLTLDPVVGRASARRRRMRTRRSGSRRTFAFGESAERSLFLLAAAIATLVFIVAVSMG